MSVIKELKLPDDLGQGSVFQLLNDIQDNFSDDEEVNEYEASYHWAIGQAIGSLTQDMNLFRIQSNLLSILKNPNIDNSDCRKKCIEYIESYNYTDAETVLSEFLLNYRGNTNE